MTNTLDVQTRPRQGLSTTAAWLLLALIFIAVQIGSLFTPPLLDDADASHAQAAQHMVETGDLVTLKVDGIRYLEKPPLPYWIEAAFYRVFGENVFATRLPNSLAILGIALLAWAWAGRAWGKRAGFYAALGVLTSIGPFLFTRFAIPEALLTFFLLFALYSFITGLESQRPIRFYGMWAALALALLTKGLIAPVFFAAAAIPLAALERPVAALARTSSPSPGCCCFSPSPRHGTSSPALPTPTRDTPSAITPLPATCMASGTSTSSTSTSSASWARASRTTTTACRSSGIGLAHLVWLFPWSLFLPALLVVAWRTRHSWLQHLRRDAGQTVDFYLDYAAREDVASYVAPPQIPRPLDLAARPLFRIHPALLFALHQPGVLHLPRVADAAHSDRGRAGRHRGTARC